MPHTRTPASPWPRRGGGRCRDLALQRIVAAIHLIVKAIGGESDGRHDTCLCAYSLAGSEPDLCRVGHPLLARAWCLPPRPGHVCVLPRVASCAVRDGGAAAVGVARA